MPSFHSICVFATAALAAFVTASPIAGVVADRGALVALPRDGAVQNLPNILTVTKAQLLAVQAEANHAVATGNVTSADAANAYVDKLSSVISESLQSAKKLKGQSRSAVLGGIDLETLANILKEVITLVTKIIQEIISNLGTQDRSAVLGHISLYLESVRFSSSHLHLHRARILINAL
ncbi:hypothetical protein H0H93_006542 [Arthromyces matolae]|nr:hypothetical protein H0H93_006542 [Arthromyces matolae]